MGRRWPVIDTLIKRSLGPVKVLQTQAMGDGVALARKAVEEGARTLLSLGGDGTHNEVVNGIMAAGVAPGSVALGALPSGTGGDLKRVLRSSGSLEAAIDALTAATAAPVDVGAIAFEDDDGVGSERFFINMAAAGMSGAVDRLVNRSSKRLGGRITIIMCTLQALGSYEAPVVRLWVDDDDKGEFKITNVIAGNSVFAGGGMKLVPSARLGDGMLDFVVFKEASLWRSLTLTPKIYSGTHVDTPICEVFRGTSARVELVSGPAAPVDIDGESPGRLPVSFRLEPSAIRLLNLAPEFL